MNICDLDLQNSKQNSSNSSSILNNTTSMMDHNLFNSLLQPSSLPYISRLETNLNNEIINDCRNQQLLHCISENNSPHKKRKLINKMEAEVITPEEHELNIKDTPAYYLGLFIDNTIISWLISETSSQNSKNFQPVTEEEMRCFIAILYLSGYVDVPRRRMLWERAPDTHCPLVSNAMQRDRFEAIFTALHMAEAIKDDNTTKFLKLRPLLDLLNERFLRHAPKDEQHSIAECFINKNMKNTTLKQLKIWCGCTKSGYCVWFDPCSIANTTDNKFNQLYLGKSVILNYANLLQSYQPSNYCLLFENCYNDMPLICELQRLGVQGSSADRDKTSYCLLNPSLGGVDRMDANINLYRISVRGKKYYSALLSYVFDVALHNAWQLYKQSTNNEKKVFDLLAFRRNVVIYYLQHYAKPFLGHKGGRPAKIRPRGKRPPPSDARFDGIRHYVIPQEKQTRCAKCTAKTTTRCQKCDVGVHVKCFVDYHQKRT